MGKSKNKPTREQAKELYEANKKYVEENGDDIHWNEQYLLAMKQDALYLAWHDNNFTRLNERN